MNRPRIVLCGVHEQGLDIAAHLAAEGLPIAHLVSLDRDRADRAKASGWVDYAPWAAANGIPLRNAATYSLKDPEDLAFFRSQAFDLMIFGGWQRLVPEAVLATLAKGCIGQHGSPEFLPRGRGRSPLNWAILEGRNRVVWHLFQVTPGIDDGPILDTEMFDITPWDDCRTLYYKVAVVMKRMLARTIPLMMAGHATARPQSGEPSYYGKRTAEDGLIGWDRPVMTIYNLIRAVTRPYPGAFTRADGQLLTIWKAQPWDSRIAYPGARLGEVVEVFSATEHVVNCGDGLLLVTDFDGPTPIRGTVYGS